MTYKPFSQACENNKTPILNVIQQYLPGTEKVLEIGSGTGQHAVYFAEHLPDLVWQTSDREENIAGINAWLNESPRDNLPAVKILDVLDDVWPQGFDAVYSANTAHIMPWSVTQTMVQKVAAKLPKDGLFMLYGPFNYNGTYSSDSNQNFDVWLKNGGEHQGIRDFEKVNGIAIEYGLKLLDDIAMPANNRLLVWKKLIRP